jgi:hypothetical protein
MIICSKDICLSFFNHSFFAGFHSYFMVQLYIICMYTSRDNILFKDNDKISGGCKTSAGLPCWGFSIRLEVSVKERGRTFIFESH